MSNIATLKDDWEFLAKQDALHAILTDKRHKAQGGWDKQSSLWQLDCRGPDGDAASVRVSRDRSPSGLGALGFWVRGRPVDPGAWAFHFASAVGVDIAQGMIEKAEAMNQRSNCRCLANTEVRLPFPEGKFLVHLLQYRSATYSEMFCRGVFARTGESACT